MNLEKDKQVDFSEFETEKINEAIEQKINWFGDPNLSLKQRFFQFIAVLVSFILVSFGTKKLWQRSLVLYLIIVCPVGTYHAIKSIINFFF